MNVDTIISPIRTGGDHSRDDRCTRGQTAGNFEAADNQVK